MVLKFSTMIPSVPKATTCSKLMQFYLFAFQANFTNLPKKSIVGKIIIYLYLIALKNKQFKKCLFQN